MAFVISARPDVPKLDEPPPAELPPPGRGRLRDPVEVVERPEAVVVEREPGLARVEVPGRPALAGELPAAPGAGVPWGVLVEALRDELERELRPLELELPELGGAVLKVIP